MSDDLSNEEVMALEPVDLLAHMGTDAGKWTQAFLVHTDLANAGSDFYSTAHSWFATRLSGARLLA